MRLLPKRKKKTPEELQLELMKKELKRTKNAGRRKKMVGTFRKTMERTAIKPKNKSQSMEWMFGGAYTDRMLGRRSNRSNMDRGGK